MKTGFNLLKMQAEPPSAWTKIYGWVIGTARVVIIVAELTVLVAFGIRIYIDVQGKDLDARIDQSEAILNVMSSSEKRFRVIQNRTDMFRTIWNSSPDYSPLLTNINGLLPTSTSIKDLAISIDNKQLVISGTAPKSREQEIKDLEANLKADETYLKDVVLARLDDSPTQLKFTFTANLTNIIDKDFNNLLSTTSTDGNTEE